MNRFDCRVKTSSTYVKQSIPVFAHSTLPGDSKSWESPDVADIV